MDAFDAALAGLGSVASTTIDLCGWALDCDRMGSEFAQSLHEWIPCIPDVGLYWRSNVVILGMVITGVGTLAAVANGVASVAITFFASFLILSFSLYYISRYAELAEMESQLASFKDSCTEFRQLLRSLDQANKRLEGFVAQLLGGTASIEGSAEVLQQLQSQIADNVAELTRLRADIAREEATKIAQTTESRLLQSQIIGSLKTLAQLTEKLAQVKGDFTNLHRDFQQTSQTQDINAQTLSSLIGELTGIVTAAQKQMHAPHHSNIAGVHFVPTRELFT